MDGQQHGDQLKRGLKNRHIQLIALGGAMVPGYFSGSAHPLSSQQGLRIILGYAIRGLYRFSDHAPAG
jgi:aromatic amino acid transport protein AroP